MPAFFSSPIVCRLTVPDGPRAPTGLRPAAFVSRSIARVSRRDSSAASFERRDVLVAPAEHADLVPLALDDLRHHLRIDQIGATAATKNVAGTSCVSSSSSTRASPCAAPNSPPVIATTAVSPRASWLAELLTLNVSATATRAPFGQTFGLSERPARTWPDASRSCASVHFRPGWLSGRAERLLRPLGSASGHPQVDDRRRHDERSCRMACSSLSAGRRCR